MSKERYVIQLVVEVEKANEFDTAVTADTVEYALGGLAPQLKPIAMKVCKAHQKGMGAMYFTHGATIVQSDVDPLFAPDENKLVVRDWNHNR